jgi:hypothetical protein
MMLVQRQRIFEDERKLERFWLRAAFREQRKQAVHAMELTDLGREHAQCLRVVVTETRQLDERAQGSNAIVERMDEPLEQLVGQL